MASVRNGRLIFNEVPAGVPVPGKTTVYDSSQTIDLDTVSLNGGILVKTLFLGIDPFIQGKMRIPLPDIPAFKVGEVVQNYGVGVVLRSESPTHKPGDHVWGTTQALGEFPFQEYFVADPKEFMVIDNRENLPWSVFLGMLGLPGLTAYLGWREFSPAKKGDVIFVSAGAGAVGSYMIVQLAKKAGCKVIASTGSDEKVEYMKKLGVDVPFNYKKTDTREVLKKAGGIDIYWDNVGGETLEAAIDAAKFGATFIVPTECGMITTYNNAAPQGVGVKLQNLFFIVPKQIKLVGYISSSLIEKHGQEFFTVVPSMIARGEIKHAEHIFQGIEQAGDALAALLGGTNKGKVVVQVAKE
ncbi:NAD P-binding protein [Gloeophyllum trabeum ATCC 11539]|uniref:NAD P-binding protein n=1 Tax=Gloeophyllum trabeum (strain ATCC 11539 / FP-39264 / Madison 617) TaxID=670483 RepID=S7QJH7_GLOTA|nr:NAD P-binding protein [Gloeophyllum trabeum ATCC 11539]EPQ59836.1 NAD P-binding protein [Gloeophyllum trabeum ATCC 11539]